MRDIRVNLKVNGEVQQVDVQPHWTLLHVLRNVLGLTGAKLGCGNGECGACTIIMNGKAVPSCLVLAARVDGSEIITIEGIQEGDVLHPLQEAFIEHAAVQCGFCTPGMILTAISLLGENQRPTEDQVREALLGNLCRCTGYSKIVEAVLSVLNSRKED
jgi:carbon-monoxide dehydrogenase small subunit